MSYILQALKKAEEARGAAPRAVPMSGELSPPPRLRWPWITGALGALAAVTALASVWTLGWSAPGVGTRAATEAPARAASAPAEPPAVAPAPGVDAPAQVAAVAPVPPAPGMPARPAATASSSPTLTPPAPAAEPARPATSEITPPMPPAAAEPRGDSRSAGGERPGTRAKAGRESSPRPERTSARPATPAPVTRSSSIAPPVERAMAAATPAPSVPPAPATPAPATGTRSRADVAAPPTAPPERAIPPRAAATAAAPAPAGEIRALVAKLTLQVLSWSPDPRDRFVFVNGRKYVEGQSIDDKLLVERITDGGVVLSYQGERATLRSP